jgi:adenylosuccinate synthase
VQPVYATLPGWKTDICGIKEFDALPLTLKQYITFIETEVGVPITLISVGPDRVQTIIKHPELLSL